MNFLLFIIDGNSGCFVMFNEGYVVEIIFNIICLGWGDEDEFLKYEFCYNISDGLIINYLNVGNGKNMLLINFFVGNKVNNFDLRVDVYVKDLFGDLIISSVVVKVGWEFLVIK